MMFSKVVLMGKGSIPKDMYTKNTNTALTTTGSSISQSGHCGAALIFAQQHSWVHILDFVLSAFITSSLECFAYHTFFSSSKVGPEAET